LPNLQGRDGNYVPSETSCKKLPHMIANLNSYRHIERKNRKREVLTLTKMPVYAAPIKCYFMNEMQIWTKI